MSIKENKDLPLRIVFNIWWPLALSWMMMSVETPMMSAVIARLPDPRLNLAAYGGLVVPIRMLIVAPVVMLLSASNALCQDWAAYQKVRRFMMITGLTLTCLHMLVSFTPLFYVLAEDILGVPPELHALGRYGLMLSTPLAWSVGYRRFQQGILIRYGHTDSIFKGSMLRLSTNALVLLGGYLIGTIPGVIVGTTAMIAGIMVDAAYAGLRVRPVVRHEVRTAPPAEPLSWKAFASFYIPLIFTSFLAMIWQPINSFSLSRMPQSIDSLAVMPVVTGLAFLFRSFGMAFNEVVVSQLSQPRSANTLRKFGIYLMILTSALFLLIVSTPLSNLWFEKVSALSPQLAALAKQAVWIVLPLPALSALRSWFQGTLLYVRRTRAISESIVVSLLTLLTVYALGIWHGGLTGIFVGVLAFMLANTGQLGWLWLRSRPELRRIDLEQKSESLS